MAYPTNIGGAMQEVTSVQRLSERVAGLKPSGIRRFFDIAATMKDVISLGIGEPDFVTPKPILDAGVRSLQSGRRITPRMQASWNCARQLQTVWSRTTVSNTTLWKRSSLRWES